LNSEPSSWATPPAHFWDRFFWDRVSWTISLGWLWTAILLISASWVAKIIWVSHQCPAHFFVFCLSASLPLFLSGYKILQEYKSRKMSAINKKWHLLFYYSKIILYKHYRTISGLSN
jgi:hypothetical protein